MCPLLEGGRPLEDILRGGTGRAFGEGGDSRSFIGGSFSLGKRGRLVTQGHGREKNRGFRGERESRVFRE